MAIEDDIELQIHAALMGEDATTELFFGVGALDGANGVT